MYVLIKSTKQQIKDSHSYQILEQIRSSITFYSWEESIQEPIIIVRLWEKFWKSRRTQHMRGLLVKFKGNY